MKKHIERIREMGYNEVTLFEQKVQGSELPTKDKNILLKECEKRRTVCNTDDAMVEMSEVDYDSE